MSLFVDLRQIKTSVSNLSEMVDKISTSVGKDKHCDARTPRHEDSVLFDERPPYKPTLGFGVRFSQSQEDVYKNMPSSRLRSHMSLPNLGKASGVFEKTEMAHEIGPKILELDDKDIESSVKAIQTLSDNINDWIMTSTYKRPHFDDNGDTHPMDFVEYVKYYMSELNMPVEKQLAFIMSCFEGVPLMWARCFKSEFKDVEHFFKAFEEEFWGADRQKAALYDMKLGKYDEANQQIPMSEYFLQKVSSYRHLNPPPSDLEIVYSLAAHFPSAVELELRLSPKPTLREAYRMLRRREGEASDFLPNYLYEMCEAFQRGQRPESARRQDAGLAANSTEKHS
ncbi:uncharacterized protein LOC125240738 [Leguminivora glycinivorella]|uniref:uncharacterized protein LOC125240738 n=1 Tax=Leguminivora glycinivorella TaxID=1035111 RepID=UPI00200D08B1|nr:uncharacterized protein LOC125240738 [Leguminivora glycinivorella]